ncbi:glycosyltransferase family 2 protein [Alloalcanivorax xenomutans]|uniref:glycosyltransferase family 2 protein n=1 Tax=Alloalcanivorax xenomutans TaxID=1094342 RepID=UPI00142DF3B9|nr:glycosyltransferase family A protein [Alloalcanivorax xenomutans]
MRAFQPKVSICCACYNRAEHLEKMLNSILKQTFYEFELIIVNDGSSDPRVEEILDNVKDDRVFVIHQPNQGFVSAIKNAIAMAKGEYIAIHGAGDISLPDRIERQVEMLIRNPNAVAVGCFYLQENSVTGKRFEIRPNDSKDTESATSNGYEFSHGEMMYRKSSYEAAGGYRDFFVVGQATDLWLRMNEIGEFLVVREILYKQFIYDDGVSLNFGKIIQRRLLHAFMIDMREEKKRKGIDPLDKYGIHAPLYWTFRKNTSKAYVASYMYSILYGWDNNEALRKAGYYNSTGVYKVVLMLISFLPFKRWFFVKVLKNTKGFKKFCRNFNIEGGGLNLEP